MNVAIVTNIPTPYRVPLFNALCSGPDIQLLVVFLAETESGRQWRDVLAGAKFEYQVLEGWHFFFNRLDMPLHLSKDLGRALKNFRPDVVVTGGYSEPAYWLAACYCRRERTPMVVWVGSTLHTAGSPRGLRGLLKKTYVSQAAHCLSYGAASADFLRSLGVPDSQITTGLNAVDMKPFAAETGQPSTARDEMVVLYSGRLIPLKGIETLIEAMNQLKGERVRLCIVGQGHIQGELEELCRQKALTNVSFMGHRQYDELPRCYAEADVVVLPSLDEIWGLTVNEALAAGAWTICSDICGASHDLITPGWNGDTFPAGDAGALALRLRAALSNLQEIRARRTEISSDACNRFGMERSAQLFIEALRKAAAR